MKTRFLSAVLIVLSFLLVNGQSPMPIIIPAATPANSGAVNPAPQPQDSGAALQGAIKMLEEMKASNEEMLKKQEATLLQLDDLQKAAEQLKIFSKRG
jgi:Skp family chaperone for outer membrane proteins